MSQMSCDPYSVLGMIHKESTLLRQGGELLNKEVDLFRSQNVRTVQGHKVEDLYRVNRSSLLIAIHATK